MRLLPLVLFFNLYVLRKLCCFGVLLEEEHVDHTDEDSGRNDDADNVCLADKDVAELSYHESDAVCKAALISDCELCPFSVVHLTLDSTDCCEAGSAKKVEYEE